MFTEPVTEIAGGPELFINKDSTINLTCYVRYAPEPPSTIIWSHNHQVKRILQLCVRHFFFFFWKIVPHVAWNHRLKLMSRERRCLSTEIHLNFITDAVGLQTHTSVQTETFFMFLAVVKKNPAAIWVWLPSGLARISITVDGNAFLCDIYGKTHRQRLAFSTFDAMMYLYANYNISAYSVFFYSRSARVQSSCSRRHAIWHAYFE